MNKASPIYKLIKKESVKEWKIGMNLPLGNTGTKIDFFELKHSTFSVVPIDRQEREKRMKSIKSKMNLDVVGHFNRKCIMEEKRVGDEHDGLVFKKINPINHIDPNMRPNSLSWNSDQFNRRIVGKMIFDYENSQKSIIILKIILTFFIYFLVPEKFANLEKRIEEEQNKLKIDPTKSL